jgi:chorismate mutase
MQMTDYLNLSGTAPWDDANRRPFLIAGPCGVESPEQLAAIAGSLSKGGVQMLRGGIWKPRTRPGSFQGIGEEGLRWLKDAGVSNGMYVTTEVAEPIHVELALKAGIDCLWVGARTVVNPFHVQRLADALTGVDIPVMVKNPLTPDLELWIGALERFNGAGITRLAAIHRGFSAYERSRYRNSPNWPIPIELKRRFPELPLFCDPSHIAGQRTMITSVSQTALDLHFDGLMVEVHHQPETALSDRQQQLTPAEFFEMTDSLVIRRPRLDDLLSNSLLSGLRDEIDALDNELLEKISRRMELSRRIGQLKKENDVIIYQLERWNEILRTRRQFRTDGELELTPDFIVKLFELIHEESIHQQTQVMNARQQSGEKV